MSFFEHIREAAPDAILGLNTKFRADTHPSKLNLGVGAYRDDQGKPYILEVVREAECRLAAELPLKEYLPIDGLPSFRLAAAQLMFGNNSPLLADGRIAVSQSVGGTGALKIAAGFARLHLGSPRILISNPTWGNHRAIFSKEGLTVSTYRYYDKHTNGVDFDGLTTDLKAADPGTIVILHACAHNPTGVDLTMDQWHQLLDLFKTNSLFPLFDCAYQGFASGSLDGDVASVRLFASHEMEMIVCQSFSKNLGLYGERVGALSVVCPSREVAVNVQSQIKPIIRATYSNPPIHGAQIASTVLRDPTLFQQWSEEVKMMSHRLIRMRRELYDELLRINTPGSWNHVVDQIGMFSFTGLTPDQVKVMVEKHHIYMLSNGRISMAGLRSSDVPYLAAAIKDSVSSSSAKL